MGTNDTPPSMAVAVAIAFLELNSPLADCRLEGSGSFQKPRQLGLSKRLILRLARQAFQAFRKDLFLERCQGLRRVSKL
jgi:hypothetical protein